MGRGGQRTTTWKKGQKPPVKRPKGSKNKKTLIKEKLGVKGWDALTEFIEGEAAHKLIREMKKMSGKNFQIAMAQMSEYVKPKLRRVDSHVKATVNLADEPIEFS